MEENNGKQGSNGNFMKYMSNPKAYTLKRWFLELLKERYAPHDNIIERVSISLVTERDLSEFGQLIMQVYESGYRKAVNDYQEQAQKMGLNVKIVTPEQPRDGEAS